MNDARLYAMESELSELCETVRVLRRDLEQAKQERGRFIDFIVKQNELQREPQPAQSTQSQRPTP